MNDQFHETLSFLRDEAIDKIDTGIILGTGLSALTDKVEIIKKIPYNRIPHFPLSTVEFHKGNLILCRINNHKTLIMQGRFHFYEGYSMEQIVYPVRIMKLLGCKRLFLSNAAGGINPDYKKGDLIIIDDHINLQSANPLIGKNNDQLGPRFPDMSSPYDALLNKMLLKTAGGMNMALKQGVYAAVNGPMLETRAEYRYLKITGADMVGMSTVPEVIAAAHMSLPCAAVSVITDECDPDNLQPINIEEIIAVAGKADIILSQLLIKTISKLS